MKNQQFIYLSKMLLKKTALYNMLPKGDVYETEIVLSRKKDAAERFL